MINVSCGTGSTGRICTDLAVSLEKLGHEIKIAYGRDQVQPQFEKYAIRIGSDIEVKAHALFSRVWDASGRGSIIGTRKFIDWIRRFDPDIIHLHNIHGYYINVPLLFDYLRECDKPIIWTLHDCWSFTGHTAFCDSANCEKWKTGCGKCPLLREYPSAYIDHSSYNWRWKKKAFMGIQRLSIVTPSHWLKKLVAESFLAEYPVSVIHNGIDTSVFKPLENDFKQYYGIEGKKVILGVSNVWNRMKGFDDFIKLSQMIDEDSIIVLVGLSKDQIEKLPRNIIGIERTNSPKELSYIYGSADVYVNLTYCDNYPTTNLEARACKTPVITYRTGGSPESAGKDAIIVERGDLKEVVKAIHELTNTKSRALEEEVQDASATTVEYLKKYTTEGGYFTYKSKYRAIGKYIVLGVASVWDHRKGLDTFLKLLPTMSKETYKFILVGLSTDQITCLPNEIDGFSKTSSIEELRGFYSIADVFLNPTIEDNYPTTNVEAACCATPVITYRTGGSPESVIESQIVNKNDIGAVKRLLEQGRLKFAYRLDFSKSEMLNNYLSIYRQKTEE